MNVLHRSRIPKKCIKSLHSNWKQNGSRNWKTCVLQCKNRFAPIHADVELPANGQNDSEVAEQKLHLLLYKYCIENKAEAPIAPANVRVSYR